MKHSRQFAHTKPSTVAQRPHGYARRVPDTHSINSLSGNESRACWLAPAIVALAAALFTGATITGGARAGADSADPIVDVPLPPPAVLPVPSAPPASAKSADGWTLAVSANSETLTPAPSPIPDAPPREFIVNGLFNGTLRGPRQATTPTPTGTIEAGYQIQCVPHGMMAGMMGAMKPNPVNVKVLSEDFKSADVSAAITDFRIQLDCMGQSFIRSYAILTRTTNTTNSVVAYYGVPIDPMAAVP